MAEDIGRIYMLPAPANIKETLLLRPLRKCVQLMLRDAHTDYNNGCQHDESAGNYSEVAWLHLSRHENITLLTLLTIFRQYFSQHITQHFHTAYGFFLAAFLRAYLNKQRPGVKMLVIPPFNQLYPPA